MYLSMRALLLFNQSTKSTAPWNQVFDRFLFKIFFSLLQNCYVFFKNIRFFFLFVFVQYSSPSFVVIVIVVVFFEKWLDGRLELFPRDASALTSLKSLNVVELVAFESPVVWRAALLRHIELSFTYLFFEKTKQKNNLWFFPSRKVVVIDLIFFFKK